VVLACGYESGTRRRVVSAIGMEPPHDGRLRVRQSLCAVRIGRNEATGMASPISRQGHRDSTSEEKYKHNQLIVQLWRGAAECGIE
jgi:hypothetical protein